MNINDIEDINTRKAVSLILLALTVEAQATITPTVIKNIAQAVDDARTKSWEEGWQECKEEFEIE